MAQPERPASRRDFEIVIICALTHEANAVEALFDHYWDHEDSPYDKAPGDPNAYSTGRMGRHNIVLAWMPGMGKVSAAAVAAHCGASFPNIKLALVVGICGVAPLRPEDGEEIVLGDVIISNGVVQYDFGQQLPDHFAPKNTLLDALGRPNTEIRSLLAKLKSLRSQRRMESKLTLYLAKLEKDKALKATYPGLQLDRLFEPTYNHIHEGKSCEACGCSGTPIKRQRLEQTPPQPAVHYGLIASGDSVMKAGERRDALVQRSNVIAFEMEGAGVWDHFPCLVIKGACDYADSHKTYEWQKYAAATAAACTKAFLDFWVPSGNIGQQSTDSLRVLARLQEINLHDIYQDDRDKQCLKDLFVTDPRHDKMRIQSTKGGLLTNVYCWILKHPDFQRWRRHDHNELLWITGDAGKGKTMLLCGIIDELQTSMQTEASALLSYFFCQMTDSRINNALSVLRGLISMLLIQEPSLISHIRGDYDIKGRALLEDVNAWEALSSILTSMLRDPSVKKDVYVVIDALDECAVDLQKLLEFIVENASIYSHVKWIVSSRDWPEVEGPLNTTMDKIQLCLELNQQSVSTAVGQYIEHEVEKLSTLKKYDKDTRETVQKYLRSNANDTFLWVSLVCHELADPKVRKWHTLNKLRAFPPGLDALYRRMLDQLSGLEDARICRKILAIISQVYRPITLDELTSFVDMPDGVFVDLDALEEMTKLCGSFLVLREKTVYLVHQSAKEFLLEEAHDEILPLSMDGHKQCIHHIIFSASLRVMSNSLRNDVYELGCPGTPADGLRKPEPDPLAAVRYSCVNWVKHLCDSDFKHLVSEDWLDCQGEVLAFLREHLLHWFEALGLMKTVSNGVLAVSSLEDRFASAENGELLAFIHDAKQFTFHNRSVIEQAPLQIYSSALIFTPQESIVRRQFEKQVPRWINELPAVSKRWSPLLQTLESDKQPVMIAFAPDQKLLASASDDTIRLWDLTTGAILYTLETDRPVESLILTADAKMMCVWRGSDGKTKHPWRTRVVVHAWDIKAETNTLVLSLTVFKPTSPGRRTCALSPDGKTLAVKIRSNSHYQNAIRLWDVQRGIASKTLAGHSSDFDDFKFSPDSRWIASGSEDNTLQLWDTVTGACSRQEQSRGRLGTIAVSENGRLIAFSIEEEMDSIYIWDTVAAVEQMRMRNCDVTHFGPLWDLEISPNGDFVASLAKDIWIWDTRTGAVDRTLEAGHYQTCAISISSDGSKLASGSVDGTLRLWDAAKMKDPEISDLGLSRATLETGLETGLVRQQSEVGQPVRELMAFARENGTIEVWDISARQLLRTLEDDRNSTNVVALSPTGEVLVTASRDACKAWNLERDAYLPALSRNMVNIDRVAFSTDGAMAASVSGFLSTVLELYEIETDAIVPLGSGFFTAMAFSTDGKLVALGLHDNTIELRDATQLSLARRLGGHCVATDILEFSPDGKLLASAPRRDVCKTIRLWDPATGSALHALEGHSSPISALIFSPDSKMLVSFSTDEDAGLWDTVTGHQLRSFKCPDRPFHRHGMFSPDGSLLALLGSRGTSKLWDVATGDFLETETGSSFDGLAFSPDGMLVASASKSIVSIWAMETGATIQEFETLEEKPFQKLAFSPDSRLLASCTANGWGKVYLWDVSAGSLIMEHVILPHIRGDFPAHITFSPDSKLLAAGIFDASFGTAKLWNTATGAVAQTFERNFTEEPRPVFSPDGKAIAWHTEHERDGLVLWDRATGQVLDSTLGYLRNASTVSFSPNGKFLALSTPYANTTWLWDPASGATLRIWNNWYGQHRQDPARSHLAVAVCPETLSPMTAQAKGDVVHIWNGYHDTHSVLESHHYPGDIELLALSPDGKTLLSAYSDQTIGLWDMMTCTAIHILQGHSNAVTAAAFSRDGELIASSSADHTIRVWKTATGACIESISIGVNVHRLAFSLQGSHLETERGVVAMKGTACRQNASSDSPDRTCRVFVRHDWVTWDMENMLWLPADYREVRVSNEENCVVVIHPSGRILFIGFDPSEARKCIRRP